MKLSTTTRKKFRITNKLKKVSKPDRFRLSIFRSSKNISAQIIDDSKNITLLSADNKVIFFESSIICAEIFLEDLNILNLNLSGFETFLSLFVILNFFLVVVLNFIISFYPLFLIHIDLFL